MLFKTKQSIVNGIVTVNHDSFTEMTVSPSQITACLDHVYKTDPR